jgi:hypothetical protein
MANEPNSAFVSTGKPLVTGGALVAPLSTALPADATTALNVAFLGIGYIGDGGVTRSESRSSDKKKAWGGNVVYSAQTDYGVTYKLTLIEHFNPLTHKLMHGTSNVTVTAATASKGTQIKIAGNSKVLDHNEWVFEMPDGPAKTRHVIPDGQITETGDVVYVDSDLIAYEATITCYPDASGNSYYEYLDDGIKTA